MKIALSIAGFDPSGGAGILADAVTFSSWGVVPQAAATALTVQNTQGVFAVEPVAPEFLRRTLESLAADAMPDVVKVGMLATETQVRVAAEFLAGLPAVPVVVDPVVRSSSGAELLTAAGLEALRQVLLTRAAWVTPNLAELAVLTGLTVESCDEVESAARRLAADYPRLNIVVTGGHLDSTDDYLLLCGGRFGEWLRGRRVASRSTHGTGCAFSSALAAAVVRFPQGEPREWCLAAKRYVEGGIRHAPGIGRGHGPLRHFWRPVPESLQEALKEESADATASAAAAPPAKSGAGT